MKSSYSLPYNILFHSDNQQFDELKWDDVLSFYKTIYLSYDNFYKNIISRIYKIEDLRKLYSYWEENYNEVKLLDFKDAFNMKHPIHKKALFDVLDSSKMMELLHAELIASKSIEIKNNIYHSNATYIATYETYRADFRPVFANMDNLSMQYPIWKYAVKCWCPSTNKPHFIWIAPSVADDPLEAIASTFQVHAFIRPYIKAIKRQGDLLFVELIKDIHPNKFGIHDKFDNYNTDLEPLTAEEYFNFLTIES